MDHSKETQTLFNFKNWCRTCENEIELPMLVDWAYGKMLFQTVAGKDFYVAVLVENRSFCGRNDFLRGIQKNIPEKRK